MERNSQALSRRDARSMVTDSNGSVKSATAQSDHDRKRHERAIGVWDGVWDDSPRSRRGTKETSRLEHRHHRILGKVKKFE
jgi:hypothetical protein